MDRREWRKPHLRRVKVAAVVVIQVLLLGFLAPSAALAAGNAPCTNSGSPDGQQAGSGHAGAAAGAQAKIDFNPPALCTGLTDTWSGSYTFASVEAGGNAIIQIGIIKCKPAGQSACDGTYRWAWAWGRQDGVGTCHDTATAIARSAGVATTGLHTFTVFRTATQVVFQVDGGSSFQTSIPIANVSCWTGTAMRVDGETLDKGDQMGGLVGAPQHETLALYEATVGGQWLSPSFSTCDTTFGTIYKCARINGQAVDIWTDRS